MQTTSYTPQKSRLEEAESQLQADIKSARIDFETALVSKFATSKNPSIYKYIKSFVKGSDLPEFLTYESITVTSDADKSNAFNNFFHSVFSQNSTHISPSDLPFPSKSLCSITFSK